MGGWFKNYLSRWGFVIKICELHPPSHDSLDVVVGLIVGHDNANQWRRRQFIRLVIKRCLIRIFEAANPFPRREAKCAQTP